MKHPLSQQTAKFWFYAAGWVRIRLRPGQTLEWGVSTPTDEGYHSQSVRWTHDGDHVTRILTTDGRDCDGRFSTESLTTCPIDRLAAETHPIHPKWPATPAWESVRSRQRDYSAEAAGY